MRFCEFVLGDSFLRLGCALWVVGFGVDFIRLVLGWFWWGLDGFPSWWVGSEVASFGFWCSWRVDIIQGFRVRTGFAFEGASFLGWVCVVWF